MRGGRFAVLDGWRGVSILLVLATHLLPLGPKAWRLNEASGPLGMSIFFTLSGFLITGFLLQHDSVLDFLIRRIFRIVPLAFLFLAFALVYVGAPAADWLPHYLFYANLPPFWITRVTSHFWSLCVEMQFYAGVALLVGTLGRRALLLLPALCVGVTLYRVYWGAEVSIVTWFRIDEILAGATLALVYFERLGEAPRKWVARGNPYVLAIALMAACHPDSGALNYLRPYLAAALVGSTLFAPQTWLARRMLDARLAYVAEISFALYVVHPLLADTWLGKGDTIVKYLKRPLLFAAVFMVAHASTFYFEKRCIGFGKRLSLALRAQEAAS